MAQENIIVTLPGGASGTYIEEIRFEMNHLTNRYELIATHKDGTETILDLSELSVALQAVGGSINGGSGDFHLTVHDPGTNLDHELIIPLGNYYIKNDVDVMLNGGIDSAAILHPGKVDKVVGMGLSANDFTTLLLDKLTDFADNLVTTVDYNPATEILGMTQTGSAGIVSTDIVDLSNKVDKVPHLPLPNAVNVSGELMLSQENFTTAYMTTLDFFDPTSVSSISLAGMNVMVTDYTGNQTQAFVIPTAAQSDWAIVDGANPAFILNKDIIQDQINANLIFSQVNQSNISANADKIEINRVENVDQQIDIAGNATAIATIDTSISALHTDLQSTIGDVSGNTLAMTNFNNEQIVQNDKILSLEIKDDATQIDIADLKTCCTIQTSLNGTQDDRLVALEVITDTMAPTVTGHTLNINTIRVDLNNAIIALESADAALLTEQLDQQIEIDKNTECCKSQQIEIDNLTSSAIMTPLEIATAVNANPGTHTVDDDQLTAIQNLPANQLLINNEFANDIAIALRDAWSPVPTYEIGDIVSLAGLIYVALAQNTAQNPTSGAGIWTSPFQLSPQYIDFTSMDGQTSYNIPGRVLTTAYVYVNGVKIRDTTYTLSSIDGVNTTLTLSVPAVFNQWVSIEF